MCKKVYVSYKIRIINDEGEKFVKFNNNVDMTLFSVARKYYSMTKDKYSNDDCTVELVGVREDGTTGVMYSKTFIQESVEDKELLKPTDEIVGEIKWLLDLLERKNKYHYDMVNATNKKQDVLLHKIETLKALNVSKEELVNEKLKIIEQLEDVRHNRRFNKRELEKLRHLNDKIDIENIIREFLLIDIPIDTKEYEYVDGDIEERMIKEIKYSNDKQRLNVMKQIKGKYKRVINDSARQVLICYNNAK